MGLIGPLFRLGSEVLGKARRPRQPPPLPLAPGSRVLLSRADHLGDLVMALPAARALAAAGFEVDLLVKSPYAELVAGTPGLAEVVGVTLPWQDPAGRGDGWRAVAGLRRRLRARSYAAVIEATEDLRSQALLASLGARWVVGWQLPGSTAYLDAPRRPVADHQVERTQELVAALGVPTGLEAPTLPRDARGPRRGVLVHPGAAGERKAWPPERFRELGEALRADGEEVAFLLGPADQALRALLPEDQVLPEMGLPALADRLAAARAFVGNDSGPAHLAAAVGTPVTVIFGPTMPSRTAPRGQDVRVVAAGLPCQPCWAPRTPFHCPTRRECLGELPVPPVLAAVRGQLSREGDPADHTDEEAP